MLRHRSQKSPRVVPSLPHHHEKKTEAPPRPVPSAACPASAVSPSTAALPSHPLLLPHPPHPRPPQRTRVDGDRQPRSSPTPPLTTRRDGPQRRRIARIGGRRARRQEEEGEPLGDEAEAEAEQELRRRRGQFLSKGLRI